jgi:arabinogalactan endo-1,4-beta-galactosidase
MLYDDCMDRRTVLKLGFGLGAAGLLGRSAVAAQPLVSRGHIMTWRGADLSFLPQVEAAGGVFRVGGLARDCVALLRDQGINLVRLRLWVNPANGVNGLEAMIAMARRVRLAGMNVLLDLHYSDTWADPGQQAMPAAWAGLTGDALASRVRAYTRDTLRAFGASGAAPIAVQIGNEITDGMLWPHGRISSAGWSSFAALLAAARQGVDDAWGASRRPRVVVHIDRGADVGGATWFFDNLLSRNVYWDICGLSYYPWWHGSLEACRQTVHTLATRHGKQVLIAETAYPWTLGWSDNTHNIVGLPSQVLSGFPATLSSQAAFGQAISQIITQTPGNLGLGACWWAPDWIASPGYGSGWENCAWFDFQGNVLAGAASWTRLTE